MGEAWWLMRDGGGPSARAAHGAADSLLVSSHAEGFTAIILRGGAPLYVRGVVCETEDRADELYRFLLFYRDRTSPQTPGGDEAAAAPPAPGETIGRMLVAGTGIDEAQASAIVEETLSVPPRAVRPSDLRLAFPSGELDFRHIAAPAGLAALSWA
jgi:hypothetical protein